jgi:phage gpG-like protein
MEINFTIEGEKQMSRRLLNLGANIKDFSPEFRESTNFLKSFFTNDVFDSQGKAIGEPWPARKGSYGWPPLQRSGRMKKSFEASGEKTQGRVWNAVDYFKYHQSKLPRHKLPRRVMMKLTETLKDKIVAIFHKGLYERTKK